MNLKIANFLGSNPKTSNLSTKKKWKLNAQNAAVFVYQHGSGLNAKLVITHIKDHIIKKQTKRLHVLFVK